METTLESSVAFPFPYSTATIPGRKHQYGQCVVNEDYASQFTFPIPALNGEPQQHGAAFFLVDGHGESMVAPLSQEARKRWRGSKGEQFVKLLIPLLKDEAEAIYKEAFEQWQKEKITSGAAGLVKT